MILNHREIFSSGALLLALSQGRPVVAPAGGSTPEIVQSAALVSFDPGGLPEALEEVRRGDQNERRAAALGAAGRWSWDAMADQLISLYLSRPTS